MSIIPDQSLGTQALAINPVLSYKYALRATPEQVERMTREQLQEMCLEQMYLLWLIISLVRNPLACVSTRLVAIDVLINKVERNVKQQIQQITDRSRIYISGDYGIEKRLGITRNVVSESLKFMDLLKVLKRDYVRDENQSSNKEYLDVSFTTEYLQQPSKLRDRSIQKTERLIKTTAKKQKLALKLAETPQTPLTCPACGSRNIICVCKDCGGRGYPENFQEAYEEEETPPIEEPTTPVEEPDDQFRALLPNKWAVLTNNAPLEESLKETDQNLGSSSTIVEADSGEIAPMVQEVVTEMVTQEIPQPTNAQILTSWLERRVGHGQIIWATGSTNSEDKYLAKKMGYLPDYRKYLRGELNHIYGSYLSRPDGSTYVICFDFDAFNEAERALDANHKDLLRRLAEAGAAPVYWQRLAGRGHLEIYFDEPVDANAAYAWAIGVCPELAGAREAYPTRDKLMSPLSWPFYQRKLNVVTPCEAIAILPGDLETVVRIWPKEVRNLVSLILIAVTPASLVPLPVVPTTPPTKSAAALQPELPQTELTESDVSRLVIAQFNGATEWDVLIKRCGGANRNGKFVAVWRGENTPSVKVDRDGRYACDYGRTDGTKKMDKYGMWCLLEADADPSFDAKADLAKRCAEYRKSSSQTSVSQEKKSQEVSPSKPVAPQEEIPVIVDEAIQQILIELSPRGGTYTPGQRCGTCGSPFFYDLFGDQACCRCLPFRGLTSNLLDRIKTYCKKSVSF